MAPQFVKPYVKTNKNDTADAEAIYETVTRQNMRFVSIKSPDQQALLSLHRARSGFIKAQTAQINQIRGLLTEFGVVLPLGKAAISKYLPSILEDAENGLPDTFRQVLSRLYAHLTELNDHIAEFDLSLKTHFDHCELSQ